VFFTRERLTRLARIKYHNHLMLTWEANYHAAPIHARIVGFSIHLSDYSTRMLDDCAGAGFA
jgi:hypothetical protein